MADRSDQRGFTLAEMLAALGILLLGITSLLGALSASVAQRRTTDARLASAAAVEEILHRLQYGAVRRRSGAESDLDLELATLEDRTVPGFDGLRWSASATVDELRPDVWCVRLQLRWLEQGDDVVEEYLRILPRQLPLAARVRAARATATETSPR